MEILDEDSLRLVLELLPPKSLGRASCTCKLWSRVAQDERLWVNICRQLWPSTVRLLTRASTMASATHPETSSSSSSSPSPSTSTSSAPGPFRSFALRRLSLGAPRIHQQPLLFHQLRILLDLAFHGQPVFSLELGPEDLELTETADIGEFDFVVRTFPRACPLPCWPAEEAQMLGTDKPSLYALGLNLQMGLFRTTDMKMIRLLDTQAACQADDLATLAFCSTLPALPFGKGLMAEVNLEYREIKYPSELVRRSRLCPCRQPAGASAAQAQQHPHASVASEGSVGSPCTDTECRSGDLVRWEIRLCRLSLKRSGEFFLASSSEFLKYASFLDWT